MHQAGTHGLFSMKSTCLRMNWDKNKALGTEQQRVSDYILIKETWKPLSVLVMTNILKSFMV